VNSETALQIPLQDFVRIRMLQISRFQNADVAFLNNQFIRIAIPPSDSDLDEGVDETQQHESEDRVLSTLQSLCTLY